MTLYDVNNFKSELLLFKELVKIVRDFHFKYKWKRINSVDNINLHTLCNVSDDLGG